MPRFKLSQETIAIMTIGLAILGTNLTILGTSLYSASRLEDRLNQVQSEVMAEARADRAAFQDEIRRLDDRARSDRESFEKHITGLTREQSRLTGIVEQMRTASADR